MILGIVNPLSANNVGSVEYHLPKNGHGWKLVSQEAPSKNPSTTKIRLYVPENTVNNAPQEFFGVTVNNTAGTAHTKESLTSLLNKEFPGEKVQLDIIETNPDSILYEWGVGNGLQERVHGWTRILTTPKGTVTLAYLTQQQPIEADKLRPIWVKALKDAKFNSGNEG